MRSPTSPSLAPPGVTRRLAVLLAAAPVVLASLAGCDAVDPLQREGTWRPSHAMDANIAAQIARPSVLVRGVDYRPLDGSTATAAVDRYRNGRIRSLADVNTGQIRNTGTGGGDTSGGAMATGGTAGQAQ